MIIKRVSVKQIVAEVSLQREREREMAFVEGARLFKASFWF